ncbi:methyl-accepting chemotaxis protein [Herbaspirillum seropedicae]|uniref:methyl-accepting chemotaxis protein n=1 Tax=Herbaspirillum seropedicae TaxID=964 RepID=UPI0008480245|nr:methyl-accepting chemotaxis protein [Herbaspirillum seropedicae]AON53495.1 methyl-accepting chemotaxis transducer transmembrane protein [Herbaspirillum seropedicae]
MSIKNLSIKAQLAIAILVLAALLVAIGASGLLGMSAAVSINAQLSQERLPKTVAADNTLIWIGRQRTSLDQAALTNDPAWAERMYGMDANARKEALQWWGKYTALPQTEEGRVLVKKVSDGIDKTEQELTRFAEVIKAGDRQAIADQARKVGTIYTAMQLDGQALSKYETEQAAQSAGASMGRYEASRNFSIVAIVAGLLLAFYSWWSLRRAIGEPMQRALRHFDAIASGDLTEAVHVHSRNEMGQLLEGLKRMQESLSRTVQAVRSGSEAISTATREIASGNLDLSSRTEQQAASLEETASSMEELTSTVKHNADNARQATTLAVNASTIAADGNAVVGRVVQTMEEIRASSAKITDIVSIIDGIAFQTNILALNAAVEAARAGEQGRGFAVVATEVRALAQRSSSAAKEIKELIMHSVDRVQAGSELVGQAGDTMSDVINAVQRVTDIMSEISAASNEQSAGIDQVSHAVTQMDEATQQNAALVEQASAAAKSLEQQAQALMQEVAIFRVNGAGPTVKPPAAAASRATVKPAAKPAMKPASAAPAAPATPTAPAAPVAKVAPAVKRPALPAAPAAAKPAGRGVPAGDEGDWETF